MTIPTLRNGLHHYLRKTSGLTRPVSPESQTLIIALQPLADAFPTRQIKPITDGIVYTCLYTTLMGFVKLLEQWEIMIV